MYSRIANVEQFSSSLVHSYRGKSEQFLPLCRNSAWGARHHAWSDAASPGDPTFFLVPHPSLPDFGLVRFGSAAGDPGLFPTRDHVIRLQLERAPDLHSWQAAVPTSESAGLFSMCWRIPLPHPRALSIAYRPSRSPMRRSDVRLAASRCRTHSEQESENLWEPAGRIL